MAVITQQATALLASSPALTATGNLFANSSNIGTAGVIDTRGYNGAIYLVIEKTGAGTLTVLPQGQFSIGSANWYSLGYQPTNGITSLVRAASAFSVGAGTVNAVLQILDAAPYMQFVATVTSTVSVNAYLYMIPT
jgi:hypothetical protein